MTKKAEQLELAAPDTAVGEISVGAFERLAIDPNVDVEKLERLIAMQERVSDRMAKAEFTHAFVKMQGELPEVGKQGKSHQGDYARFADIQRTIRPVLEKHGFVLNYLTDFDGGRIKVTAVLSHEAGHSQETSFLTDPDTSGKKNSIQAQGSAQSYGMRYATLALLNIVTHGMDDDGVGSEAPEAPGGYEDWLLELEAVASEQGMAALQKFWKAAPKDRRAYLTKWNAGGWVKVKATAAKAGE